MTTPNLIARLERQSTLWAARHGVLLTRLALGLIFFWFGVLKFFPGQSEAEDLAGRTIVRMSAGHVHPSVSMPVLACWECAIGLGFVTGSYVRCTLALLFLQLPGTFMPLYFFPHETWKVAPWVPTLLGQYIIKNVALVCAGILIGATMRGGRIIADPRAAESALWMERVFHRYRRRFGREPGLVPMAESIKGSGEMAPVAQTFRPMPLRRRPR